MDEDFRFIMTCIKHSPPAAKPNFDEVAKEIGAKSANAWYVSSCHFMCVPIANFASFLPLAITVTGHL